MKKYIYPKKKYYKSRKHDGKCANCGKEIPDNLAFSYIDESNISITRNAPYLCWECYNQKYNDKITIPQVLQAMGYKVILDKESKQLLIGIDEEYKTYNLPQDIEKLKQEYKL